MYHTLFTLLYLFLFCYKSDIPILFTVLPFCIAEYDDILDDDDDEFP